MDAISLPVLFGILLLMLVLSAAFSGSETGLMTLNRYRMKHLSQAGHGGASRAAKLLDRPDRLIGLILLGNNLVNIAASAVATMIGIRLFGDVGVLVATVALTIVVLIFSEVTPKTLAALHPERIAYPAAYVYTPLLRVLWPVVMIVNMAGNGILRLFGVSPEDAAAHSLSSEELRTVVAEAGAMIPRRHQQMLLSILDMEKATVEDIMVPRNEIVGIDIDKPWPEVLQQLVDNQHTRLPLFDGSIDELHGIVHMRRVLALISNDELDRDALLRLAREPYFVPENTPLNQQLLNFQNQKRRIGFVVDEYGDIQGLVTLEDILEEIVGEFTTDPATRVKNVYMDADDSYLVDGTASLRSLNRAMGWQLPVDGPRTMNGLITEHLETIPQPGTKLDVGSYVLEIARTRANLVETVRVRPPRGRLRRAGAGHSDNEPADPRD
ncbi:membrane protein [Salinisphaera orenii MK-B5]|uniref:Magnesium and cobalt efflux protein CorC n=1 Tax=Salinisphaera orenii MK-B5 TaxID=856730 RepID=A0A423PTV8_9GAMM|nr:HlyC/CorC family transporter [Salinisphaera orenii]ROO29040.1 membrane protein [Salinisphaera orenii MK-B5]